MRIWGVQKLSFVDYPEQLAAVCFTVGCNLRCKYCYNTEFVVPEAVARTSQDLIEEEAFFWFLENRRWLLDAVVICGGEPTLQGDLESFIKKIKAMWYKVKLDTNGFLPNVLEHILEQHLIDYAAIDIKLNFGRMHELVWQKVSVEHLRRSLKIIRNAVIPYEYRTTLIKGWHTLENVEEMLREIAWAPRYVLQNYFPTGRTVDPNFEGGVFTPDEMSKFADMAKKYVAACIVRA